MIDFNNFTDLLVEKERSSDLLKIGPKPSTSIQVAIDKLVGFGSFYPAMYSKAMVTKDLMAEFNDAQYDSLTYGNSFETFDAVAKVIVEKLKNTNNVINDIKDEVSRLKELIDKQIETLLASDPFTALHYGKETSSVEYDSIDWKPYSVVGSDKQIINNVHTKLNIRSSDIQSLNLISLSVRKLVESSNNFSSVDLPTETITEVLTQINTELDDMLLDDIRDVFKIITDMPRFNRFRSNIVMNSKKPSDISSVLFFLEMVKKVYLVMNILNSSVIDLSKTAKETIANNCKILDDYLLCIGYILVFNRRIVFNETLVLPGKLINPDNKEEYLAQNGDNQMIAHHLAYLYEDGIIPVKGIMLSSVITMAPKIKERVRKEAANTAVRIKLIKNDATRTAVKNIFDKYLKQELASDRTIALTNPNKFINNHIESIITQNKLIEDVLYELIVSLFYKNTFVEVLYKRLGNEYIKLLSNKTDINNDDVLISEINVYTDLICDFLFKFVEKKE